MALAAHGAAMQRGAAEGRWFRAPVSRAVWHFAIAAPPFEGRLQSACRRTRVPFNRAHWTKPYDWRDHPPASGPLCRPCREWCEPRLILRRSAFDRLLHWMGVR